MSSNFLWERPPRNFTLRESDVHVWCVTLDQPAAVISQLTRLLSLEEKKRAKRFVFEKHRQNFTVSRGLLRLILSHYLDVAPERLEFEYLPQGKPILAKPSGLYSLNFNLSHSGGIVLYAIAKGRALGIDVELVRSFKDMDSVAKRFFSPSEYSHYSVLAPLDKPIGFFNCWTRKEAYLKALGDGLVHPLDQFAVTLAPSQPAKLLEAENDLEAVYRWSLVNLIPAPGYAAALAVDGPNYNLSCWQWDASRQ